MTLLDTVRSLINQRLCAAAEDIFVVIERILTDYEHHAYCSAQQRAVLDMVLNADINHRAGFLHLPVCTEELSTEQQERNSRLVQEEPEPPHSIEEQKDMLQRPEEDAESPFTLLTVKLEEDDENGETEPLASTSTDHVKTQADIEDCGTSQPTRDDQLLSPHCSESDTEDSDEWEETREGQSALNTLKSHKTQHVEEQRLTLNDELCQDSSKQTLFMRSHRRTVNLNCTVCGEHFSCVSYLNQHMRSHIREKTFTCTVCRKSFSQKSILINHMTVHSGDKPFACTVCEQSFKKKYDLKVHMRIHTGERPFTCTVCERTFNRRQHLKGHMKTHTFHT